MLLRNHGTLAVGIDRGRRVCRHLLPRARVRAASRCAERGPRQCVDRARSSASRKALGPSKGLGDGVGAGVAGAETQTRSASAGLRLLSSRRSVVARTGAAGAWLAPEGGQEIFTTRVGERERDVRSTKARLLGDAVRRRHVGGARAVGGDQLRHRGWLARARRRRRASAPSFAMTKRHGAAGRRALGLASDDGCGEGGAEAALAGRPLLWRDRAFVNVEAAARALERRLRGRARRYHRRLPPRRELAGHGASLLRCPRRGRRDR